MSDIEVAEVELEDDPIEEAVGNDELVLRTAPPAQPRKKPELSIHQATAIYGKRDSQKIVAQEKTKAWFANREIIRRLMTNPGSFKTGELNFIAGTAVDKVAKKERWEKPVTEEKPNEWITKLVEVLSAHNGTLKLEVTTQRPEPRAIDVAVIPEKT